MIKTTGLPLVLITVGAFFAFFVFGFADNLKGPVIPAMLRQLDMSYTDGSNILLLSYLGFMVATLVAGTLADQFGNRSVMVLAGIMLTLGIGGTGFASGVSMLYVTFFVLGFGLGSIEIAANGIIIDSYPEKNGFYLNILAFFHGAGSMIAPLFAGKIIARGAQWNSVYKLVFILPLLLAVTFFALRYTQGRIKKISQLRSDVKKPGFIKVLNKELLLFSVLMVVYVASEIGIASWIVEFLQKDKGLSIVTSSLYLSLYFGFMTVGRLLGSTIVDRMGHLKILKIASFLSIVTLVTGIFAPQKFAIIIPLTGFFFSIIFPTLTAAAAVRNSENRGSVFGILFFFAGLGGMIGPWIVGTVADFAGIKGGMSMTILFAVLMFSVLLFIPKISNTNE